MTRPFLWLHIKKAGGTSIRQALRSHYPQVDRFGIPSPFIMLPKEFWNDNLNSHHVPLGGYDFRRMEFARRFLYSEEEFQNLFKFAIVRNPYARAVSAWRYLTKSWKIAKPRQVISHYSFQHFLERLPEFWENIQVYRHIATHTAPVWADVTDESGKILLDYVGRLENLEIDFQKICDYINIERVQLSKRNTSGYYDYRKVYNKHSKSLIENYYWSDINEFGYDF